MGDFAKAHAFTARWEGGFTDHPADPGGVTNHGVSLRFLRGQKEDIDGDGEDELLLLEGFHGDEITINRCGRRGADHAPRVLGSDEA